MTTRYNRAPSEDLLYHLVGDGLLAPLLRPWTVAGLPLDLQFREGDEVHLYCGLTRLVRAKKDRHEISLSAYKTYQQQPCAAQLFRKWLPTDSGFGEALAAYLADVQVGAQWVSGEGLVQAAWMAVQNPWVTLDREAVIGRASGIARSDALEVPQVQAAFDSLGLTADVKTANELDQLAIDEAGRLVLVELKQAAASDIGTAPLQLLRYIWEWHAEMETLLPSLNAVLDARKRVGLLPSDTPALDGRVRAAIAWGEGMPSAKKLQRMREVRSIVDAHLPEGVVEVEVWALRDGKPFTVS